MNKKDPQFKPGDRILCIDASGELEKDKIYTFLQYYEHGSFIRVKEFPNSGYYTNRFILSHIQIFNNKLEEIINEV